jgi:cation diffusion facilitator CzcD-associated flavoprotein CzcO
MDDDVLLDIGELRDMIPLRTPLGLRVDLLSAQHPIEGEMIELAAPRTYQGVKIPVAPLGGILLVKTKADRTKDIAAIEQTAEHLPSDDLKLAIKWAKKRDASTTEDLQQVLAAAKGRLAPKSTHTYKPHEHEPRKPRTPRKS